MWYTGDTTLDYFRISAESESCRTRFVIESKQPTDKEDRDVCLWTWRLPTSGGSYLFVT